MAQITVELDLTATWQLVGATAFIGQRQINGKGVIEITNADALPSGTVTCHQVQPDVNLSFPAPASGNWYARVATGTTKLVHTAV